MTDQAYYEREKAFWDAKGGEDYATLSPFDRERTVRWIGWEGRGRVLDLGGGAGMISRLLMTQPQTNVVCLDISAAMLRHAPVSGTQGDATRLPFASGGFDLVVAAAFIHHMPGLESLVLRECHRILAPGGRMVGYDPNGNSIQNRIFMGNNGPLRPKVFTAEERPIVPDRFAAQIAEAKFVSLEYEYFTFRNETKTVFESIQTHLLNPFARGRLQKRLERWFFWRAVK